MSTPDHMISSEIELSLVVANGSDRTVRTELTYAPDDPYAVHVAFHAGSAEVVEWTFARQLLTEGITHAVGNGDVKVWPSNTSGSPLVCLSLSSPSGRALFEASLLRVVEFLTRTYELVPTGCESAFVDVDGELTRLLDES